LTSGQSVDPGFRRGDGSGRGDARGSRNCTPGTHRAADFAEFTYGESDKVVFRRNDGGERVDLPRPSPQRESDVWARWVWVTVAADHKRPNSMELALETRGLRRTFGELAAVDGIDLAAPRGCLYGFLGPNGAGNRLTAETLAFIGQVHGLDRATLRSKLRILGDVPDRGAPPIPDFQRLIEAASERLRATRSSMEPTLSACRNPCRWSASTFAAKGTTPTSWTTTPACP